MLLLTNFGFGISSLFQFTKKLADIEREIEWEREKAKENKQITTKSAELISFAIFHCHKFVFEIFFHFFHFYVALKILCFSVWWHHQIAIRLTIHRWNSLKRIIIFINTKMWTHLDVLDFRDAIILFYFILIICIRLFTDTFNLTPSFCAKKNLTQIDVLML